MFGILKPHAALSSEIDLEMFVPQVMNHRASSVEVDPRKKTKVIRIDANGQSSVMEVKRSEVLKITEAAAAIGVQNGDIDAHADARNKGPMMATRVASPRRTRTGPMMAASYHNVQTVHARDLRKFDATFASTNDPFVTVRKQAILISAAPVNSIIMRDACLFLMPEDGSGDHFVPVVKEKLHELLSDKSCETAAFEFHALEAVLYTICKQLCTECSKTFPQILIALDRLAKSQASGELDTLRAMKNTINDFNSQVEGIRRVLMELLDNDENLRLLHLSDLYENPELLSHPIPFNPEESEVLLESYLQEIHAIRSRVRLLQDRIHNTESLVMLKLDSTRNHLLTVDVIFSLMTMSLTFGMFITAAFGMNLQTGLEKHNSAFSFVLVGSLVICVLIIVVGVYYFRRRSVLVW